MSISSLTWLIWVGIGIVAVLSLTLPAATLPGNTWWLHHFHTPQVTMDRGFGQDFVMSRGGLDAIEFRPVRDGSRLAGNIQLALVDVTGGADVHVVRSGSVEASELVRRSSYRYEFTPIEDSIYRTYRFEITGRDSSGVALLATKGDRYADGTLTVNGRSRWADLLFQTSVSRPTPSVWRTLWTRRAESGRASGTVILALLAVNWMAMGFLFRLVLASPAPR